LATLAVASVLLGAWLALEQPNEVVHVVEYGFLGVLILRAGRASGGIARHPLFALGVTAALGFVDELTQGVSPNRFFGWHDVAANAISGALGLGWLGVLEGASILGLRPYWLCER
ncbi:MAG: VanZ family protein, partial [Candidatus Binatia bacterium]